MSRSIRTTIQCSCQSEYDVETFDSVNAHVHPELREEILQGTFHVFQCANCKRETIYDRLLVYIDIPRRQWFVVLSDADLPNRISWQKYSRKSFRATMKGRAAPYVANLAGEMQQRLVFGLASLREKCSRSHGVRIPSQLADHRG